MTTGSPPVDTDKTAVLFAWKDLTEKKGIRSWRLERKYILVEKRGAVAKITINRPEKRNALSRAAIREMLVAFEELRNDDSIAVRC